VPAREVFLLTNPPATRRAGGTQVQFGAPIKCPNKAVAASRRTPRYSSLIEAIPARALQLLQLGKI